MVCVYFDSEKSTFIGDKGVMDNLDLLIEKFKEAKDELQKAEDLEKARAVGLVADDAARAVKLAGIRGGQARMLPNVPASLPGTPATPPIRSAAGIRGGTARMLPNNLPQVGSARGVRGTPAGEVKQLPRDMPKVGSAAAVRGVGTDSGKIKHFQQSEEKLTFNKSSQWSLDKGVNTIGGAGVADDGV